VKKNSLYKKEINLELDDLEDSEKIYQHFRYTLDDLNDEKNIKEEKAKLEYIDFEMYKFIF
jgi:hypothetical protein